MFFRQFRCGRVWGLTFFFFFFLTGEPKSETFQAGALVVHETCVSIFIFFDSLPQ